MATTIGTTPTPWFTTVGPADRTAVPPPRAPLFPGPANHRRPSLRRPRRRVGDVDPELTTTTSPAPSGAGLLLFRSRLRDRKLDGLPAE